MIPLTVPEIKRLAASPASPHRAVGNLVPPPPSPFPLVPPRTRLARDTTIAQVISPAAPAAS